MLVGIIAEGETDKAVIRNILKGRLGIERSETHAISPIDVLDETDLKKWEMMKEQFSNWSIVRQHCIDRVRINEFFETSKVIDDGRFMAIHIDVAERKEINFDVIYPEKTNNDNYVEDVRQAVFSKMTEWLESQFMEKIAFGIAVEELDAWILANFESSETGHHPSPKERLHRLINGSNSMFSEKQRRQHFSKDAEGRGNELSFDFRKPKKLEAAAAKNASLNLFCRDLDKFKT